MIRLRAACLIAALCALLSGCPDDPPPAGWTDAFDATSVGWLLNVWGPAPDDLYAVGGDSLISRLSGIAVDRVRAFSYLLSGLLAALTGLFLTSRMGSGDPSVGAGLELDSIAAVLLGGTVLGGGRGGLVGTLAGVLVLVLLGNVFNQLGLRFWHQQIAKGIIIILALVIYKGHSATK